jgi:nucleotide-binding universal stress UspA family protein
MLPYKNILVPHAGTKTGDNALKKAIEIAKECDDGKITILSVVEPVSIPSELILDSKQSQKISELQFVPRSFKKPLYKKMERHVLLCKREKITPLLELPMEIRMRKY